MGTIATKPVTLTPTFERIQSWDIKSTKRLLATYREKDLDFGLDAHGLSEIVDGDKQWAEAIIDAFGGTNGIVNALAFICGAVIVCNGSALEKAGLVFDVMDFDMTEVITMDEMTIGFLCSARGFYVMSGSGKVATDEELENVTLQAYRDLNKSANQTISKSEFTKWVLKYIVASPSAIGGNGEATIQDMMIQFGMSAPVEAKSLTQQVMSEMANEKINRNIIDHIGKDSPVEADSDGAPDQQPTESLQIQSKPQSARKLEADCETLIAPLEGLTPVEELHVQADNDLQHPVQEPDSIPSEITT